ncbi:DUF2267 domain-containing protein [Kamptonema formosum]|uniref:DUF2267 domain-containing protein n=1 Tax=Kamptonema formosum TaxID=331992 RepID=UPI00034A896B|nr:DUF2267 domain-containing protein [Oscillatoria sp. PCC 10802]
MEANFYNSQRQGPAVPTAPKNMPFLEKVRVAGELEDISDAREIALAVFRTMRELIPLEASDRVAGELQEVTLQADGKPPHNEIASLWEDTNPLVRFFRRLRPAYQKEPDISSRIRQKAGLASRAAPEAVIKAVFSATKDELSPGTIQEIGRFLPGEIRRMWEESKSLNKPLAESFG